MHAKKWIGIAALLLIALLLGGCGGAKEVPDPYFAYVIDDNSEYVTVVRYKGDSPEVVIPETLAGLPVKVLASNAFEASPFVTSLSLPASMTILEDTGFKVMPNLETLTVAEDNPTLAVVDGVLYHKKMKTIYCYPQGKKGDEFTIPDSVATIGAGAFYNTQLKTINMSSKVTKINAYGFAENRSLTAITLPEKLSSIGTYGFFNCSALTEIVFPERLTSVGDHGFEGCSGLKSLYLPSGLSTVGESAFAGCSSLETVEITAPDMARLEKDTFADCVSLRQIVFKKELTGIGENAFRNCEKLEDFPFSSALSSVGAFAFNNCAALKEVQLPDTLAIVGGLAFHGTAWMDAQQDDWVIAGDGVVLAYHGADTDVTVPDGVKVISYMNETVRRVTVPEGVTVVREYAFSGCEDLEEILLPNTLTTIGAYAFSGCKSLKTLHIPDKVERIGNYVFEDCLALEKFTVSSRNNNYFVFQDALCDNSLKKIIRYPAARKETKLTIPYGFKGAYYSAFQGCRYLEEIDARKAEEFSAAVDYIFSDCVALRKLDFHINFNYIGDYAFRNCVSLSEYENPLRLNNIGISAFEGCAALRHMRLADQVARIGENAFDGMDCEFRIYDSKVVEQYMKSHDIPYVK